MATDIWNDYPTFVNTFIPKLTVVKLKQVAEIITRTAGINLHLRSGERKQDVVDKIRTAFETIKRQNNVNVYRQVRKESEAVANNGASNPVMPPPTFGGVHVNHHYGGAGASRAPRPQVTPAARAGASSGWHQAPGASTLYSQQPTHQSRQPILQDWKPSPMWKPIKALTNMEQLPDIQTSESSHTRRERRVHFTLPQDVITGLNNAKADPRARPQYSVRLFCASSDYYRPPTMAPQAGAPPVTNRCIPIEYPINPDCMVDDHMVPFKERGLRGKAGSAPPLDLDKGSRGLVRIPGRMGSLIVGHTGPTVGKKKENSKKFWFQMVYCEFSSMDDLLARLQALRPTSAVEELAKLRRRAAEDDDIEVGTSTLSLKDPLSGMRITKPVRSSRCTHLQCFDARWWLESNKNHPQWLCPHCSKELKFDDVICDGYFLSILNVVPDSYDEVVLESNGDWHTADAKFGSADWMAANGSTPPAAPVTPVEEKPIIKRSRSASEDSEVRGKRRAIEILSDSDDDSPPKAPNGHHANGGGGGSSSINGVQTPTSAGRSTAPPQPAVIDLTLSDSDDDEDDEPAEQPHFRRPGGPSTSNAVAGSGARSAIVNKYSSSDVPLYAQGLPPVHHLPQPVFSPKTVVSPSHYHAPHRNDIPPPPASRR